MDNERTVILLDTAETEHFQDSREVNEPRVAVRNIRRIVDAAKAAEVQRLVYLAPLRQAPEDCQAANDEVRRVPRAWLVIRTGPVYGP